MGLQKQREAAYKKARDDGGVPDVKYIVRGTWYRGCKCGCIHTLAPSR